MQDARLQDAFWAGAAITLVGAIVLVQLARQSDFAAAPALAPAEATWTSERRWAGRRCVLPTFLYMRELP